MHLHLVNQGGTLTATQLAFIFKREAREAGIAISSVPRAAESAG